MTDLVNRGLIFHDDHDSYPQDTLTIIATGVARGGTSMIAQVLQSLGLFLGDTCDQVVVEDVEILRALQQSDLSKLDALIAERNERFPLWGFKVPNLHSLISTEDMVRFRNPRLIAIFRDPVAIARRNAISMGQSESEAIEEASRNIAGLTSYVRKLSAPALLLSYEKALRAPGYVVDAIVEFCGLWADETQKAAAAAAITPDNLPYIVSTRPTFLGHIDNIRDGTLRGWCYHGEDQPVVIEMEIDGKTMGSYSAGDYRDDLATSGIGSGWHAFNVNLHSINPSPWSIITVRPAGQLKELPNSGRSVAELRQCE